jgi:hypothetical protein
MAKDQDMTLAIDVFVTGTIGADNKLAISATYKLASCIPPAPQNVTIVEPNGNIDLRRMAGGADFTNGTDIFFNLSGSVAGPGGDAYAVFFQSPVAKAVTIERIGGGRGSGGLKASFPSSGNTSVLLIDDLDRDEIDYSYSLHLVAHTDPPSYGNLDPSIVNR